MPNTKMTDKLIKELYYQIANHYSDCKVRSPAMSLEQIKYELYTNLQLSMSTYGNSYSELEPSEQIKAYTVLETFLAACPQYRAEPPADPATFFQHGEPIEPPPGTAKIVHITHEYYQSNNDLFLTWMILDSLNYSRRGNHGGGLYPGSHNGNHSHNDSKSDTKQAFLVLAVVVVFVVAVLLTVFALYYLWAQLSKSFERFLYNEGWLKATLSLMGTVAGGIAAGMLAETLAGLALMAGLGPVGLILGIAICLTIVGAATGLLITNLIQDKFITSMNQDALDPEDPYLFTLTDSEADRLRSGKIIGGKMVYFDPVKVKCAILAIRATMGEPRDRENWDRFFDKRTDAYQSGLDRIRKLRRGDCDMINLVVGDMHFDCRMPAPVAPVFAHAAAAPVHALAPAAPVYASMPVAPVYASSAPVASVYASAPVAPAHASAPLAPLYASAPVVTGSVHDAAYPERPPPYNVAALQSPPTRQQPTRDDYDEEERFYYGSQRGLLLAPPVQTGPQMPSAPLAQASQLMPAAPPTWVPPLDDNQQATPW